MRILGYHTDPNHFGMDESLTVAVEYLAAPHVDLERPYMLMTSRIGRTLVMIEGNDDLVQPYLKAIQAIREGVNHSHNSA